MRSRVGGDLWFGDVSRHLRTNLASYAGQVWLVTVTAPAFDSKEEMDAWNATAKSRWGQLHRAAKRRAGRVGLPVELLAVVWQVQARGALHVHLVLGYAEGDVREGARYYARGALKVLASRYGFGYVDARDRGPRGTVMEGSRAARYLSKYLSESAQFVRALRLVRRPVYVARALTAVTLCTMRRLRRVRFLYVIRSGASVAVRRAGRYPAWFRDPLEYGAVCALARPPG